MPVPRSYPENYALTLDGVPCGALESAVGGDAAAAVVEEPVGAATFVKKHLAGIAYDDLTLQIGFGMGKPVYDWIAASWAGTAQPKNGAVTATAGKAQSERSFTNAFPTRTTVPALDGASKDAAYMTIAVTPERTETTARAAKGGIDPIKQKAFLASSFRLELDGVDCSRVAGIDSFTVVQQLVDADADHGAGKRGAPISFPNLRVAIGEAGIATWESWFDDFVIAGNNGDGREKDGAIVFLGPDLKSELGRVALHGVGIFALRTGAQHTAGDAIRLVFADLYCERMELHMTGAQAVRAGEVRRVADVGG